jgi:hypothetical protein
VISSNPAPQYPPLSDLKVLRKRITYLVDVLATPDPLPARATLEQELEARVRELHARSTV